MIKGRGKELREYVEAVLLAEPDVTGQFTFGHTRSAHQYVLFTLAGRERRFVFSGTPGDKMALLATRTSLRRFCRECREGHPTAARPAVPAGPRG